MFNNCDEPRELSRTLVRAIVELSLQGCIQCSGFGHSYLKCLTYKSLKAFGNSNKFIKQAFKFGLESINNTEVSNTWAFKQGV